MYIDPELRDRVYQLFSLEVPKMLQTIETELVTLSIDRSAAKVNSLMRAAHSIKGGAASLGLEEIGMLAHQIEDIFRILNHPELPFDRKLELLLFEIFDCFDQLIKAEINNEILTASFHTKTQIVLANLDEEIGHFVIVGQQSPDGFMCGVDLTQSIFEVDVAQSLARLERLLLDPNSYQIIVGEFRAQSEVFTGIAALTNTPGFGNLASTTIAAFDRHPDRAREICCFALVDFYVALEAVLTGDRATCGQISPGLEFLLAEQPHSPHNLCAAAIPSENDLLDFEDRDEFDFLIEDLLIQSSAENLASLNFDLVDIFDNVLSDRQIVAFLPEVEDLTSLNFDLVDIFVGGSGAFAPAIASSLRGQTLLRRQTLCLTAGCRQRERERNENRVLSDQEMIVCSPAAEDLTNLNFDLVDIFDNVLSDDLIKIFLPEVEDLASLDFDLVDLFDDVFPHNEHRLASADSIPAHSKISLTIAELTDNFHQLAPVSPTTFSAPAKVIKPARIKKSRKATLSPTPQLSIRVSLDRLERMNNLIGELAIERHGLALHNEQVTNTLTQLRSKCENFQAIGDQLRTIADTLVISATQISAASHTSELPLAEDLSQQFDVLELDRYGEVHQVAQATIEQIAQIEEQIEDLAMFATQSHRQIDRQKQLLTHLRDDLMWARMLPLGEILNRFPRTLHDLSIEFNKPVDLKILGSGVLVDRAVIDKLLDPLLHLLRNAFDHGIDLPAARQAMGKPERGSIEITAYHQGSQTVIEITDDGRGIDLNTIRSKVIALELLTATAAATATRSQLLDFLFAPGFSTAERVTKLSGRGMGLDIVKAQIESIKGTISIDSQVGRGTTFTLRIPLTLTIAQLMVCQVGNAVYAFPTDSIQKVVVPTPTQLTEENGQQVFHWRNLTIPVYNLVDILTYSIPVPERTISHTLKSSASNPEDWLSPLLLIRRGDQIVALGIDRLITEQELTIKPFGKAITPPSYSYGCTILGDGIILPVLDPHTLIQDLIERPSCSLIPDFQVATAINSSSSILVVDDSITTRQSLCLTLEKFGYRTLQAKDGQEALQLLRQKTSEIQLVVCDVEMPNMNGFEFLNVYRQDKALTHIPVVMLTSRSNTKHRQFATHLGAVDYFIKPYIEQDFMIAIEQIIANQDR